MPTHSLRVVEMAVAGSMARYACTKRMFDRGRSYKIPMESLLDLDPETHRSVSIRQPRAALVLVHIGAVFDFLQVMTDFDHAHVETIWNTDRGWSELDPWMAYEEQEAGHAGQTT